MIHFPTLTDEEKKQKDLMTRTDVLNYFGVSKSTLYRWTMVENKLPFIKIGRRKFYKFTDIEIMIEKNYSPNFSV